MKTPNSDAALVNACITGIGVWGPGFSSLTELDHIMQLDNASDSEVTTATPKPEVIPARERRRAPLSVKLSVEVATQACSQAGIGASEPACVFASGIGDTDIIDYMCRALATPDKMVSPTRFHNSVHNAAAGYWTISTDCRQAATSIAAFSHSFPVALLESLMQLTSDPRPVLLVLNDIAAPSTILDIHPVEQAFAVAVLLERAPAQGDNPRSLANLGARLPDTSGATPPANDWPVLATRSLASLYGTNPAARSLALLEGLRSPDINGTRTLQYPLSDDNAVTLDITPIAHPRRDEAQREPDHAT